MVDYNFFEGYKVKKSQSSLGEKLIYVVVLFLIIGDFGYIAYNYFSIGKQGVAIASLNQRIEAIQQTDDISRIREKQMLLEELKTIVTDMNEAGDTINADAIVNEDFLISVADALPSDVKIIELFVEADMIFITGEAMSKSAIAEFEYNLRSISYFSDLFVSLIDKEGNTTYTFELEFRSGGGASED